jgi:hypothetical protein
LEQSAALRPGAAANKSPCYCYSVTKISEVNPPKQKRRGI